MEVVVEVVVELWSRRRCSGRSALVLLVTSNDATTATSAAHRVVLDDLHVDRADQRDFEAAERGFVAALGPPVIRAEDGRPVWALERHRFVEGEAAPRTVNPSLWRQAGLRMVHGLFTMADRIDDVDAGRTRGLAPGGFLSAAVSENVIAGVAMARAGDRRRGHRVPAPRSRAPWPRSTATA